ncbi:integrase_H2C2 domain-containing protein [Trichonephila clavata]|uniref:Integrase_H2C2 domain-containing protein n=1 Tax=Trichonephila clavata TaxID=2740835 RepID=A0A8X6LXT1_TRICU|nr:integrase_H2C2 domain-containing protein [Trichonephila clavata]
MSDIIRVLYPKLLGSVTKRFYEMIFDLLAEDEKALESDIANEIENHEVYSDDFITLSRQVSERLRISGQIDVGIMSNRGSSVSRDGIKQYRLLKIELKKFNGELINWLYFWSQFEKINSDPDLFESDKFYFPIFYTMY